MTLTQLPPLTDDELTALALAADPREQLEPDAVAFSDESDDWALLPTWYMPAPIAGALPRRWWSIAVAIFLIGSFVTITALGFCITYGRLEGV
jgi:hypothetical protein